MSIITRLEMLEVSSNEESGERRKWKFWSLEIKGATKREREREEEQWRCKVATCGYRGVNHITLVRQGASWILIRRACRDLLRILNARNDPLPFSDRERLVRTLCILLEMNEGVEGGWSHVTRQIRDPSPPQADYREEVCASVPRV